MGSSAIAKVVIVEAAARAAALTGAARLWWRLEVPWRRNTLAREPLLLRASKHPNLHRSRIALAGQRLRRQFKASPRSEDAANARGIRQGDRPGATARGGEHGDEHAIVS